MFELKCETCNTSFGPMVATRPGELLSPDAEEVEQQAGPNLLEQLQSFHRQHGAHELAEVRIDS